MQHRVAGHMREDGAVRVAHRQAAERIDHGLAAGEPQRRAGQRVDDRFAAEVGGRGPGRRPVAGHGDGVEDRLPVPIELVDRDRVRDDVGRQAPRRRAVLDDEAVVAVPGRRGRRHDLLERHELRLEHRDDRRRVGPVRDVAGRVGRVRLGRQAAGRVDVERDGAGAREVGLVRDRVDRAHRDVVDRPGHVDAVELALERERLRRLRRLEGEAAGEVEAGAGRLRRPEVEQATVDEGAERVVRAVAVLEEVAGDAVGEVDAVLRARHEAGQRLADRRVDAGPTVEREVAVPEEPGVHAARATDVRRRPAVGGTVRRDGEAEVAVRDQVRPVLGERQRLLRRHVELVRPAVAVRPVRDEVEGAGVRRRLVTRGIEVQERPGAVQVVAVADEVDLLDAGVRERVVTGVVEPLQRHVRDHEPEDRRVGDRVVLVAVLGLRLLRRALRLHIHLDEVPAAHREGDLAGARGVGARRRRPEAQCLEYRVVLRERRHAAEDERPVGKRLSDRHPVADRDRQDVAGLEALADPDRRAADRVADRIGHSDRRVDEDGCAAVRVEGLRVVVDVCLVDHAGLDHDRPVRVARRVRAGLAGDAEVGRPGP